MTQVGDFYRVRGTRTRTYGCEFATSVDTRDDVMAFLLLLTGKPNDSSFVPEARERSSALRPLLKDWKGFRGQ